MNRPVLLLLLSLLVWEIPSPSKGIEVSPPAPSASATQTTLTPGLPDFEQVVLKHGDALAAIASEADALKAFTGDLGRALGLSDAALTLQAKALPASLVKELFVQELQESANRLMAGLAALRLARSSWAATQSADAVRVAALESDLVKQREWLERQGVSPLVIGNMAKQLEVSALEKVFVEWTRLHHWKDQVRDRRGQARLCGTWQWTIHNHKTHGEQKLVMTFPPPGAGRRAGSDPTELVVLGDNVYLRWEVAGRVQEDSLQFTKEGQRLEGTFVNNLGGWGSIAAKRSGACVP
jgi:hypothetical protein